jgi:hypothetical protein
MKKEYKRIVVLCNTLIGKEAIKKLKKIENYKERTEGLKYLINSKLRLILLELESNLEKIDKKESLILESKIKRLKSKIKIFHSTHSKNDWLVLQSLIREIKEEEKNVRSL